MATEYKIENGVNKDSNPCEDARIEAQNIKDLDIAVCENIALAKEYMRITYSPKDCTGRDAVKHLVSAHSRFIAPTTFPDSKDCTDYAEDHKGKL